MVGIDVGLYDFDRHNAIYFFIVSPDEQIYLRYGGRDAASADSYLDLDSFVLALETGLERHARWKAGDLPARPRPAPLFPREIERLRTVEMERGRCVECHMIGDYLAVAQEAAGRLDKRRDMFRSPDIRTIGIHLDVPRGLVVERAEGPAAAGGLQPGDRITTLEGTEVLTFGDLLYVYDAVDRVGSRIDLTVERNGDREVALGITLPTRWWLSDIDYRYWSVDPVIFVTTTPLPEERRQALGLRADGFACEVSRVNPRAEVLALHDLQPGDVLYFGRRRGGRPGRRRLPAPSAAERHRRQRDDRRHRAQRRATGGHRTDAPPVLSKVVAIVRSSSMKTSTAIRTTCAAGLTLVASLGLQAEARGQSPARAEEVVWMGDEIAVTYAARLEGEWLVVEARHEPGWHTYAMDNVERAAAASGREAPETELPTRITPRSGLVLAAPWHQSEPLDLSDPDIRWHTWGFEGLAFFASRVVRADAGASIEIDAQACTDRLCAMVDGLRVAVTPGADPSVDPESLAAVPGAQGATGGAARLAEMDAFAERFHRGLDLECSGAVPITRLVEVMDPGRHRPRQMNWVMELDVDGDGIVELGEVALGLRENLRYQVARRMAGDVDGDDALDLREHSLFVPDPGAETNEMSVSAYQEKQFAAFDQNGDRKVSRDEIIAAFVEIYIGRHWGRMVLFHLARADRDGDGTLTRAELGNALAGAGGAPAPGAAVDRWVVEVASASPGTDDEARLVLAELPGPLSAAGASVERRAALEGPIAPLLTPTCRQ